MEELTREELEAVARWLQWMEQVAEGINRLAAMDIRVLPTSTRRLINGHWWECVTLSYNVPLKQVD